jgi:hypothetical protein
VVLEPKWGKSVHSEIGQFFFKHLILTVFTRKWPHGSTICFVVVLVVLFLVVVLVVVGESLIKILLYSPILFYFTMLLQQ